jgi:hypothetical protein
MFHGQNFGVHNDIVKMLNTQDLMGARNVTRRDDRDQINWVHVQMIDIQISHVSFPWKCKVLENDVKHSYFLDQISNISLMLSLIPEYIGCQFVK